MQIMMKTCRLRLADSALPDVFDSFLDISLGLTEILGHQSWSNQFKHLRAVISQVQFLLHLHSQKLLIRI